MMDLKPLHAEQDYDWAIREVTRYFEAEPARGTADGDRFEVLSILIKAYGDRHFATLRGDQSTLFTLPLSLWASRRPNWQRKLDGIVLLRF